MAHPVADFLAPPRCTNANDKLLVMDQDTRIRRFVVFVDTNTIWTKEDAVELMPAAFRDTWQTLAASGDVELRICDVVLRELAYQREKHFVKQAQEAHAGLTRLSSALALGSPDSARVERVAIRSAILSKLRSQMKEVLYCSEVPVAGKAIAANLMNIIDSSVWRSPPFKEKGESGFRDAIILETVKEAHAQDPHSDFALITRDERLVAAAEAAFGDRSNFGLFSTLDEYAIFLNLARQRFTPDFLHAVTAKAGDVFEKAAYSELKIRSAITDAYELKKGEHAFDKSGKHSGLLWLGANIRTCSGDPEFHIVGTELVGVVEKDEFHWATNLVVITPYGGSPPSLITGALEEPEQFVRILQVNIQWSAVVSQEQTFRDFRLIRKEKQLDTFVEGHDAGLVLQPGALSSGNTML